MMLRGNLLRDIPGLESWLLVVVGLATEERRSHATLEILALIERFSSLMRGAAHVLA